VKQKRYEESKKPQIEAFLKEKLNLVALKDISMERDGKLLDRDYVAKRSEGEPWLRIECKIRSEKYADTGDILIETKSNVERKTLGWIYTSKADLLAYLWPTSNGVEGYVINLPKLQNWWKLNKHRYPNYILAPNPPGKPIYHTKCHPIPVTDLPKELFIYLPDLTTLS
jgi:hypothetical protein